MKARTPAVLALSLIAPILTSLLPSPLAALVPTPLAPARAVAAAPLPQYEYVLKETIPETFSHASYVKDTITCTMTKTAATFQSKPLGFQHTFNWEAPAKITPGEPFDILITGSSKTVEQTFNLRTDPLLRGTLKTSYSTPFTASAYSTGLARHVKSIVQHWGDENPAAFPDLINAAWIRSERVIIGDQMKDPTVTGVWTGRGQNLAFNMVVRPEEAVYQEEFKLKASFRYNIRQCSGELTFVYKRQVPGAGLTSPCNWTPGLTNLGDKTGGCPPLYRWSETLKECVFTGDRGLRLNTDSRFDMEELIKRMEPGQSERFAGSDLDGAPVVFHVLRRQDGNYAFTTNGIDYYDAAADAVKPGRITRMRAAFGNFTRSVRRWFGVGAYTGRGTAGDAALQAEMQVRYDAAAEAHDILRATYGTADAAAEAAEKNITRTLDWAKESLGSKWDELVLRELKELTGCEIPFLVKVLSKDWEGIGEDLLDAVKGKLYSFPADAVVVLGQELGRSQFASAAHLYIEQRQAGKQPGQILAGLLKGDLSALDIAQLSGHGQLYATGAVVVAYEEAYQRYLLKKGLQKG